MSCNAPDFQINSGWRAIAVGAVVTRSFDFTDYKAIKAGASVSSATVEASANGIVTLGSPTVSNDIVSVSITGDAAGEVLLQCMATLDTGDIEPMVGGVKVFDPLDCDTY